MASVSDISSVNASLSKSLSDKSCVLRAFLLSLDDVHVWIICDFISSSMFAKPQSAASFRRRVWYKSTVSPLSCLACRNKYHWYSLFTRGTKRADSLRLTLSNSALAAVALGPSPKTGAGFAAAAPGSSAGRLSYRVSSSSPI